jgi:hypothetical protein
MLILKIIHEFWIIGFLNFGFYWTEKRNMLIITKTIMKVKYKSQSIWLLLLNCWT